MGRMAHRDHEQNSGCTIGIVLSGIAALPMLYVLSFGPAARLCVVGWISEEWIWTVYFPIDWLCKFSWFSVALNWYVDLWLP